MGKTGGFMETSRELPSEREPLQRLKDWKEFSQPFPENKLRAQAGRCMECGTPFCQTGLLFGGMASGCPINNLIPEWNDLAYRGLWREALERLHLTNNFPEFTGRVCPAPCEGACVLGIHEPPTAIKLIEKSISDQGFAMGWVKPHPPAKRTGSTIAVVGSGPAGLACAAQLNKAGHSVTVFERADRIGGLLMYGIPNMKLAKETVQRRVNLLVAEGVSFRTGVEIGTDISWAQLRKDFSVVVLCTGATKPRDLPLPGRQLKGVHYAMEFLTANTRSLLDVQAGLSEQVYEAAKGRDVVIIGGGDTGTDCVGTSLRHGCRSVIQLEIMPKPPLKRAPGNPWPEWPKVLKTDYGQAEAHAVQGEDPRKFLTTAHEFLGDAEGNVRAVRISDVQWTNKDGRMTPVPVPGSEREIPAQLVLLAMGFLGPEQPLLEQMGVTRDERSNVKADYGRFATSVPGVFAAGDCRRGQSLVVWAINEGRAVAREVDRWLTGSTTLP